MQREDSSWVPLSQATAQFWAFEAMADAGRPRRRRLMPTVRVVLAAVGRLASARRMPDALGRSPRSRSA